MRNAELDESQTEIKIARRNINSLRYADDITLTAEGRGRGTKEPLDEGESEVSDAHSCLSLIEPMDCTDVAHQAPLSMEFSRQEHRGGLPFPFPGIIKKLAIKS